MATGEGLAHSNLFVKSQLLSQPDFDEAALLKIFSPYGHIDSCRLVIKPKHSIAFVRFSGIPEAEAALSLNGTQVNGFTLEVKLADADAGPPAAGVLPCAMPSHTREAPLGAAQHAIVAACSANVPLLRRLPTPCLPALEQRAIARRLWANCIRQPVRARPGHRVDGGGPVAALQHIWQREGAPRSRFRKQISAVDLSCFLLQVTSLVCCRCGV